MFSITQLGEYRISTVGENKFTAYFPVNVQSSDIGYYYDEALITISAESVDIAESMIAENLDIYKTAAIEQFNKNCKAASIQILKNQLQATDYKLLKSIETYMLGISSDYDVAALIYNREGLRNSINMIENPISDEDQLKIECNRKVTELHSVCQAVITTGINVGDEHFSLNTFDQINISTLGLQAQAGVSVPYHADGKLCKLYTPQEFLPIAQAAAAHVIYHTTYFNCLKNQVQSLTSIDDVRNTTYGDTLLPEYAAVLSQIVGSV